MFKKLFRVKLSDAQLADKARCQAKLVGEIEGIEAEKSAYAKGANASIEKREKELRELSRVVREEHEDINIDCEWRPDPTRPMMVGYRLDTGEIFGERPMTEDERQQKVPGTETPPAPGPTRGSLPGRGDSTVIDVDVVPEKKGEVTCCAVLRTGDTPVVDELCAKPASRRNRGICDGCKATASASDIVKWTVRRTERQRLRAQAEREALRAAELRAVDESNGAAAVEQ